MMIATSLVWCAGNGDSFRQFTTTQSFYSRSELRSFPRHSCFVVFVVLLMGTLCLCSLKVLLNNESKSFRFLQERSASGSEED